MCGVSDFCDSFRLVHSRLKLQQSEKDVMVGGVLPHSAANSSRRSRRGLKTVRNDLQLHCSLSATNYYTHSAVRNMSKPQAPAAALRSAQRNMIGRLLQ